MFRWRRQGKRRQVKHDARFEQAMRWGEPSGIYQSTCSCGWRGLMYLTPAEAELEAMEHDPVWQTLPGYAEARGRLRLLIEDQKSLVRRRFS